MAIPFGVSIDIHLFYVTLHGKCTFVDKMHGNPVFQQSDQKCYDSHIVVSLSQLPVRICTVCLTDDPSRWCCPCWRNEGLLP